MPEHKYRLRSMELFQNVEQTPAMLAASQGKAPGPPEKPPMKQK
jgi:hypothetical protein